MLRLVICCVVGLASTAAHADAPGDDDKPASLGDRAFAYVAWHAGLGTPVGLTGIEAGIGDGWFRAGAGVGVGWRGLEIAAMVRALAEVAGIHAGGGFGVSRGGGTRTLRVGWREPGDPDFDLQFAEGTVWVNGEAVVEIPIRRIFLRFYAGISYAAAVSCEADYFNGEPDRSCTFAERRTLERDPWLGYAGGALGIWFAGP